MKKLLFDQLFYISLTFDESIEMLHDLTIPQRDFSHLADKTFSASFIMIPTGNDSTGFLHLLFISRLCMLAGEVDEILLEN